MGRSVHSTRLPHLRGASAAVAAVLLVASLAAAQPALAFGSSTPPAAQPSVSAGGYMTCGVDTALAAACWGNNVSEGPGQANPPAGIQFSEVNSGYSHACGVRHDPATPANDKTAVCWGSNTNGASTPPFGMKFSHVAPGFIFTCGLRQHATAPAKDKTAVCWGSDDAKQVTNVPVGVKFTQLTVGIRHACGLRETPVDGNNIVCWGYDGEGQLSEVPAGTFSALNSGNFDICALSPGGSPTCWGRNAFAQSSTPPGETFTQVSAGFGHVCGLRPDGTLRCWGRNNEGQATPPAGTFNNVSAGTFHSCGMTTGGTAVCWGSNTDGRSRPTMTSRAPVTAAVVGVTYSHQFTSTYMSSATWVVSSGTLPPGLWLDSGTGLLEGSPDQAGTFADITVSASNSFVKVVSEPFTITVTEAVPDTPPTVSVGDVSVHEGNTGTRAALFTVSLSKRSSSTVTVGYTTAPGTATAPADYVAKTGTVSFAPGVATAKVKVGVVGDGADEANETFALNLSSPTNATLADTSGTGTILDDDPGTGIGLAIGDVAVHEGDEGVRTALFTVSLSKAASGTVKVDYVTADGTATRPGDYTPTSGTLTFAPGVLHLSVKVTIRPDTAIEFDETFAVDLSAASGARLTDFSGLGTIIDDDRAP